MFERLPQELLNFIISEISTKDVKNLSQTSKHFHSATLHTLWESVVILGWCKDDTYVVNIDGFPLSHLIYTKNITLCFPTEHDAPACPHNRRLQSSREADGESITNMQTSFETFKDKVLEFLEKCHDRPLSSFRRYNFRERKVDLLAFRQLHYLRWRGPTFDNLKAFAAALKNNKAHLQTLELDIVEWQLMRMTLGYQNDDQRIHRPRARDCMARGVFGLDTRSPRIAFPNLHTLILSHVPLTATLAQAVDFETLRSLTIRLCPQWYDFVLEMTSRDIQVKLKKLEIQELWPKNDNEDEICDEEDPVEALVNSFGGLEELYLDQVGDMFSKYTWENVCAHGSTLKRFANHSRFYAEDLDDWTDLSDMMIKERDKELWRDDPTSSPFYELNLDFLGLSCKPIHLLDTLNPFSRKDCLKVVHVRQSRQNMEYTSSSWGIMAIIDDKPVHDTPAVDEGDNPSNEYLEPMFWAFVEWAFSHKGIKSLEYIVFGDYGRPKRTSRGNLLICRQGYGSEDFHIIRESCPAPEWDYVKKEYGDAMRCCPLDPLFEVPRYRKVL
ncbi:hypothetical protein IL306_001279 [Fusarium sp. DS 682]|nr:hypothetical protein IL306_001279 [Fusarium sp. DS 682]